MKAMILAAGLGTRLRPLTDTRPKALVEINGRTLLEITLTRLRSFGVNEVIINVHHLANMVVDYLNSKNNFGMRIEISREDDLLLDTGGGLKKASWFFLEDSRHATASQAGKNKARGVIPNAVRDRGKTSTQPTHDRLQTSTDPGEPFLLHNVDVISTIDLHRMFQFHKGHGALTTLAVQSRDSSRLLLFNDHLELVGRAAPGATAGTKEGVIPSAGDERSARVPTPVGGDPGDSSLAAETKGTTVIPGKARNRGKESAHLSNDQAAPTSAQEDKSALSSPSALATRHSPLPLAFSGLHIISPRLLPLLTEEGVFSIIDAYLRLAAQGEKILAFRADEYYWRDLGRPADLSQAALDLQQNPFL